MTDDTRRHQERRRQRAHLDYLAQLGVEPDDLDARLQLSAQSWRRHTSEETQLRIQANASLPPLTRVNIRTQSW